MSTVSGVPVIDLSPFLHGSPSQQQQVARQFDEACQAIGFITLTGHGVSPELMARMKTLTRQFFELPLEVKQAVLSQPAQGRFCGYVGFAADAAARIYKGTADTPPDLRERFRAVVSDAPEVREKAGPLQWPRQMPELERVWLEYHAAMESLGNALMRVAALALGLTEGFFVPYFDRHFSVLMATHSPPVEAPAAPGQMRCGEHTDNGTLTVVHQDDAPGGIQILDRGQRWVDVRAPSGAFVVNIGDLMARWTNDRWVSTVHRVGNPPDGTRQTSARQSIVFFHQPNLDATITCLEPCVLAERPAKYGPITLREHFTSQQQRLRTQIAQGVA
jgi:isopenicillin N synthase-like dioxygenase